MLRDLDDLYDSTTVRRIERAGAPTPSHRVPRPHRARHGLGATALATGIAFGLRDAFEPPVEEPIVEEIDLAGLDRDDQPVTFHYVHGAPRASRAFVRRWLLPA